MLGREEKRLESELEIRTKEVDRLTALQEGVQRIAQIDARTNLEAVEIGYKQLSSEYEEEYNLYNVASAALGQVIVPVCTCREVNAPLNSRLQSIYLKSKSFCNCVHN